VRRRPQCQQAETIARYKQHNVNPVAGCLPILLQMPAPIDHGAA
jgi:membrane protein insertase Oxa1/YidC/SpoIIIJ